MKKMMLLCIIVWLCHAVNAQNTITGRITDQDSLPLSGATIFLPDMNKGTVSNANGEYALLNLPSGKIKLRFSYVGYARRIETIELSEGNQVFDIMLAETAIEAEEIIVSGGYSSTQHENAVKIDVLRLDPMGIKATPNFTEILTKIPGVDMISKGSGVSRPVIRGLAMNDILVLNNGVRWENYQYSSHHPLGIDEFGIEDVEIIKGPASLLFGSDAIGGAVNFIRERPAPIGTIAGDYQLQLFSNTMGVNHTLGVKGATKKFFGGLRFGQKTHADFLQGGGDFVPNSRFNEASMKATAGFTDKIGTFRLYYDYNHQRLGLVEDEVLEEITGRGRKNVIFYQDFTTHLLSSQNKLYLGTYKVDLNAAYQNTELIHFGEADTYELQMALATVTYDARLYFPSDKNSEYILGFQGMNQANNNLHNRETILLPDALTNNTSAYCLIQSVLLKKLKIQTGIRYDYKTISTQAVGDILDTMSYRPAFEEDYGSFSGSLGATYYGSEELLLRANFAAAYRTPNLAELTSNGPHELRYEVGERTLIPENSYETDVSMHYHGDRFTFDLAGFINRVNHHIFIAPTGDTTATGMGIYKYRQSNSTLYGGEAGVHAHPKRMEWLHLEAAFSVVIGKQENGDYLPFIPAHKLRLEARAEKELCWIFRDAFASVNFGAALVQNNAAPDETTTPGYLLIDFTLGGDVKIIKQSVKLALSANNLLDTQYIDHCSTLKEVNFYNPGRNIAVQLKIPF